MLACQQTHSRCPSVSVLHTGTESPAKCSKPWANQHSVLQGQRGPSTSNPIGAEDVFSPAVGLATTYAVAGSSSRLAWAEVAECQSNRLYNIEEEKCDDFIKIDEVVSDRADYGEEGTCSEKSLRSRLINKLEFWLKLGHSSFTESILRKGYFLLLLYELRPYFAKNHPSAKMYCEFVSSATHTEKACLRHASTCLRHASGRLGHA